MYLMAHMWLMLYIFPKSNYKENNQNFSKCMYKRLLQTLGPY